MYLHLASTDCKDSYPNNHPWDFTVNIGQHINLQGGWEVAMTEISYDNSAFIDLYVYSDICSSSYVTGSLLPLLRITNTPAVFTVPHYIPLSRDAISHLRVYIRTIHKTIPSFHPDLLRCTLHLRRR